MKALFVLGCIALIYSGFCRMAHTDATTKMRVRLAIWAMTAASLFGIYGVLFLAYLPGGPSVSLVLSQVALQFATVTSWHGGVPARFRSHASTESTKG